MYDIQYPLKILNMFKVTWKHKIHVSRFSHKTIIFAILNLEV